MTSKQSKGSFGEKLAREYLEKSGMRTICTNWRYSTIGEIDIISMDRDVIVFIEVKTRSSVQCGHPLEAVNERKMKNILKLSEIFLAKSEELDFSSVRYDVVSVITGKEPTLEHFTDVYQF